MTRFLFLLTSICLPLLATGAGGDISFDELFVTNRTQALKELIPGSRQHYYYTCLHYQQKGDTKRFDECMKSWIKRYRNSQQIREMLNRQALLTYEKDPQKSLKHIINELKIRYGHSKIAEQKKQHYPKALNADLISWEQLKNRYLNSGIHYFSDAALEKLAGEKLNESQRRNLLKRLKHPAFPNLAKMVIDDLNVKHSGGFGSIGIHSQLTKDQLDDCIRLDKSLLKNHKFVNLYIQRMRPEGPWHEDDMVKATYLTNLLKFTKELVPSFNSLKAHVLLHLLDHQRHQGKFDQKLFLEYLKIPRSVHYINRKHFAQRQFSSNKANLHGNFQKVSGMKPVHQFESQLVTDFFEALLKDADTYNAYTTYVDQAYLKRLFATIKTLHGKGDPKSWFAVLGQETKTLRERVELRLLPQNKKYISSNDKVSVSLTVKNVPELIVKTYRINLFNYYTRYKRQVSTAIDLDGLVAANEQKITYKHAPQIRHTEVFNSGITGNGAFVMEFIGNGISSRALIIKGTHRYTVRDSSAGHIFHIYDENNRELKDAEIHMRGHVFKSKKKGFILIPYSTSPRQENIIVKSSNGVSLNRFYHRAETYTLRTGFYINREELIDRAKVRLVMRPQLSVNGNKFDVKLLKNTTLTITSQDANGIKSSTVVKDFKLYNNRESVHAFFIPKGLKSLSYKLSAEVEKISDSSTVHLSSSNSLNCNAQAGTSQIKRPYLRKSAKGYIVEVLGRSGEAFPNQVVNMRFNNRFFTSPIHTTLKTDEHGEVFLGNLIDITSVSASLNGGSNSWKLERTLQQNPSSINVRPMKTIQLPFTWSNEPLSAQVALIKYKNGLPFLLKSKQLRKAEGSLEIFGLDSGKYRLLNKKTARIIDIDIEGGQIQNGYITAKNRYLQQSPIKTPRIGSVVKNKDGLFIKLHNSSANTRVHVFTSRFVMQAPPALSLAKYGIMPPQQYEFFKSPSHYLSGRDIGDEYRYILTRRSGRLFPGNMLERPALLLNPWALRDTNSDLQKARSGRKWQDSAKDDDFGSRRGSISRHGGMKRPSDSSLDSNFNFLHSGVRTFTNLSPDKQGLIQLKNSGPGQIINIVLIDGPVLLNKEIITEDDKTPYRDLRFASLLDANKHYIEKKKISIVKKGTDFVLRNASSGKVETYDSLRKVYALLKTLNNNTHLEEFNFILEWPKLKEERKRELYSEYACHELNYFIFKKDPAFYQKIVLPYVKNKKDNTFLDDWFSRGFKLGDYSNHWKYSRLNIVEKILLARKLKSLGITREVKDLFDLIDKNPSRFSKLFDTAIQSGALSNKMSLLQEKMKSLEKKSLSRAKADMKSMAKKSKRSSSRIMKEKLAADSEDAFSDNDEGLDASAEIAEAEAEEILEEDSRLRSEVQAFYREVGLVKEWVENNYYKLPLSQHLANRVKINAFWADFAAHQSGPFISPNIATASSNFTEMMYAISVLDLPFESGKIDSKYDKQGMHIKAANDMILYHREVDEVAKLKQSNILISQNFYDINDRYRMEGNERVEKYITEEFENAKVYGARIVITNPTARNRHLEILTQLPEGAIAVNGSQESITHFIQLRAYSTTTSEYYFYFPSPGKFQHFPIHVSQNGKLAAYATPFTFNVVSELTKVDKTSWLHISQNATENDVIKYMKANNLHRLNLGLIAWRLKDKEFCIRVLNLLEKRKFYHSTTYSYALLHQQPKAATEFIKFSSYANNCGLFIKSPLLDITPQERFTHEHKEYSPMINARAYQLGHTRKIVNSALKGQYNNLLKVLRYKSEITDIDKLALIYYQLLQDRITEAIERFKSIDPKNIKEKMQYDYMAAYIHFYLEEPKKALAIANNYRQYPVDKWRNKFLNVIAQANESTNVPAKAIDPKQREQKQNEQAGKEAAIDFNVSNNRINAKVQNLKHVKVNYYIMDIELLFSRRPFIRQLSSDFSLIEANHSAVHAVKDGKLNIEIPEKLRKLNIMVELSGKGLIESKAYYPNTMNIALMKNHGMLQLRDLDGKTLSKVYVKVYARDKAGRTHFHKDGYTDLRGKFDYSSVNTGNLDNVDAFSILILSEKRGALIKETTAPKK